jgi:hypothetical protein
LRERGNRCEAPQGGSALTLRALPSHWLLRLAERHGRLRRTMYSSGALLGLKTAGE